MEIVNNLKI